MFTAENRVGTGQIPREKKEEIRITILEIVYQLEAVRKNDIIELLVEKRIVKTKRTAENWIDKMTKQKHLKVAYLNDSGRRSYRICLNADAGIRYLAGKKRIEKIRRAREMVYKGYELENKAKLSQLILKIGWKYLGSKDAKIELDVPSRNLLQAMLIDPTGEKHILYYLWNDIREYRLVKLARELHENNKYGINNLVIYESCDPLTETPAFQKLKKEIKDNNLNPMSLCMLPDCEIDNNNFVVETLRHSTGIEAYLQSRYQYVKEITNRYHFGNKQIIDEIGEEWLVCNYLKRDIVALETLAKSLTKNEHKQNGYKAIILTWKGYAAEVQQKLESVQEDREEFIKIITLERSDMADLPDCD